MSQDKKTTTIQDVQSSHNDVGMHIGQHAGNLNVIGARISHGKVGIMIGGDPSKVVGSSGTESNATVNINGDVNAPFNFAAGPGANINALTINEILAKIDASSASQEEKLEVKSKLKEFIAHPLVTSIVGGLAGGILGG
jgi:hypothetical protein